MPFSISIGDFIATAKLINDIVSSLKRTGGAASKYQELERELFGLQRALNEIEHLRVPASQQPAANAIKCAALNCQYVLEEFESKLSKYERNLGCRSVQGKIKAVGKKLQWGLGMTTEVTKLRV